MKDSTESHISRSIELCRRTVTTESLIKEAKAIYGDKYDYSKVKYINSEHRITVYCPIHGDFDVFAREHLDGRGCSKCEKGEKFIKKLVEKFGDKYGLENFIYNSSTTPVELTCPKHGSFSKLPNLILNSSCPCPECIKEKQDVQKSIALQIALEREARKEEEQSNHLRIIQERAKCQVRRMGKLSKFQKDGNFNDSYALDKFVKLYREHIDDYIDIIRRHVKWELEPYRKNLLDEHASMNVVGFEPGDVCYKFPGEAINDNLLQILEDSFEEDGLTIEDYLSHRDCYISFDNGDLFIRWNQFPVYITDIPSQISVKNQYPESFVGIDFETLYSQRVSACSVGMVKYKRGEIVDRYYSLIKPPHDYPGKKGIALTWIHGFTEDQLRNERTFADILPEMEEFAEGLPLVAHNSSVERSCIKEASQFYGLSTSLDYDNILDTLPLARIIEKRIGVYENGPGMHTLDAVCRRFNVQELHHHNALDDAEMCGNLMLAFFKINKDDSFSKESLNVSPIHISNDKKVRAEDKVQRTDLDNVADNIFKNKNIVLTGFTKSVVQEYGHMLKELGAIVHDGVTKKTQILITGPNAGPSKISKCQEMGAVIMSEEEFLLQSSKK